MQNWLLRREEKCFSFMHPSSGCSAYLLRSFVRPLSRWLYRLALTSAWNRYNRSCAYLGVICIWFKGANNTQ
jgi:hypothetical protein